jgi:hypothetical protein
MRTFLRGKVTLLFMVLGLLLAIPAVAYAAELVTNAEVDSTTVTSVTVTQGQTANFDINVGATGAVECASIHSAKVAKSFSMDAAGAVTGSDLSDSLAFGAGPPGGGGVCMITGGPYTVPATITAAANTPPGTYTNAIELSEAKGTTTTFDSNSTGAKLDDKVATYITVVVEEAQSQSSCTFSNILQPVNADGSSAYKFGAKGVIPAKFTATCDGNPVDTLAEAQAFQMKLTFTQLKDGSGADTGDVLENPVTGSANTGNLFRFDDAADQFIYNVNIKGLAKGDYKIGISPNDITIGGSAEGYFTVL